MIRKFNLTKALCAVSAFTFLVSCTKSTDVYDQSAVEENQKKEQVWKLDVAKAEYTANFEMKYGKSSPTRRGTSPLAVVWVLLLVEPHPSQRL